MYGGPQEIFHGFKNRYSPRLGLVVIKFRPNGMCLSDKQPLDLCRHSK